MSLSKGMQQLIRAPSMQTPAPPSIQSIPHMHACMHVRAHTHTHTHTHTHLSTACKACGSGRLYASKCRMGKDFCSCASIHVLNSGDLAAKPNTCIHRGRIQKGKKVKLQPSQIPALTGRNKQRTCLSIGTHSSMFQHRYT